MNKVIQYLKGIPLFFLILFQITPIILVLFFVFKSTQNTNNQGWIYERDTGCKFHTGYNYENRSFDWTGNCEDGFASGFGELTLYQNGIRYYVYEGTILKGKAHGQGKLVVLTDGDVFEGNFRNGKLHGFGSIYNDDGDHYEGQFIDGKKSGKGTYWYSPESNLFKYSGSWENNMKHGTGMLFYRNGNKEEVTYFKNELIDQ